MKSRNRRANDRTRDELKTPLAAAVVTISRAETGYPSALKTYLGDRALKSIFVLGNPDILRQKAPALFCSVKCPGNLILQTYDLARQLRDDGIAVLTLAPAGQGTGLGLRRRLTPRYYS